MPRIELRDWQGAREQASAIRFAVFVREQRVPAEIELDEHDAQSIHAMALEGSEAIGTGRLLPDETLEIRVTDGGSQVSPQLRAAGPDALDGRGLTIVAALSTGWGVERDGLGQCVWATL